MAEITNLMRKLSANLFELEAEQSAFLEALINPRYEKANAVIWTQPNAEKESDLAEKIDPASEPDWLADQPISFLEAGTKPGKSNAYEIGAAYPIDVSSTYTASAMLAIPGQVKRVLDVCAAPGGKTLFAASCLKPDYQLANELIGKRLGILRHNLKKTGLANIYTQKMEAYQLAEIAQGCFDLAIVDAPCSGQSLLAKGIDNPGCFHPNIVKGNAKRQLRILSQTAPCVIPGGYLFYSTCTFAIKENEGAIEKFLSRNPEFTSVEVKHLAEFQSRHSSEYCYRIYPHQKIGSGGFTCLLRKSGEAGAFSEIPAALTDYSV